MADARLKTSTKKGQSIMEYVALFLIVAAAFSAIYTFAQRAVNGKLLLLEDMSNTAAHY